MLSKKKVFVNAANCHTGGGKTLLNGFIKGLKETKDNVIIFINQKFEPSADVSNNVEFIKVNWVTRFLISFEINKKVKEIDDVVYFGNLPPFLKFRCNKVYLLLSSRFYVENISFRGFSLKDSIKIRLEKFYFNIFIGNISCAIVQTSTMQKLLQESGFKKKISVWAFDDIGETLLHTQNSLIKEPLSFIYVASLLPYKNHHRLLKAWKKLKDEGIEPRLYLTIDQDNSTKKIIEEFVLHNKLNVVFLKKLCREELIKFYEKAEFLIYPSYFEAYGLPLIEAKKFQLKILAADIDYSWDFLIPDDFFNPHDVDSIVRALKRSLKVTPKLDTIYSPKEFINKLMIE